MIITTPALDEQQNIINFFSSKESTSDLSHIETVMLMDALEKRHELISGLAALQKVDRRELVRARLGIK